MYRSHKIATCCYCGARAALSLGGDVQHELSCTACGAPLHELKQMPVTQSPARRAAPQKLMKREKPRATTKGKRRKTKKKKSLGRWFAEEMWDFVEDIFD